MLSRRSYLLSAVLLCSACSCDDEPGGGDASVTDRGRVDTGINPPSDSGQPDLGLVDSGLEPDAGLEDAGLEDSGLEDSGLEDGGLDDRGVLYHAAIVALNSVELHDISGGKTGEIPVQRGASQPRWSPTGAEISLSSFNAATYAGEVSLWEISSGTKLDSFAGRWHDWSPDGQHLVSIDVETGCIRGFNVASGIDQCLSEPLAVDDEIRWDPSGAQRYAYLVSDGYNGEPALFVRDLVATRFEVDERVFNFSWSPLGDQIAYIVDNGSYYSNNCSLVTTAISAFAPLSTVTLMTGAECEGRVAWSPTGMSIAYGDSIGEYASNALFVVDAAGPTVSRDSLTPLAESDYYIARIEWTPDGEYIGYSTLTFQRVFLNMCTPDGQNSTVLDVPSFSGEFSFRPSP